LHLPHPVSGEPLQLSAGLNELAPLFAEFGWPVDETYYQQQFAELFKEGKWQKSQ